ncbi:MAG: 3-methyl-2-oxobutanoate dehydrogenase subunit VorB [Deltaproteobacteria bacterium]|nr:3-methyl-2-oxobutanoate dehydrogenase subunit VorB [Deltaproteobacteria bacterium]
MEKLLMKGSEAIAEAAVRAGCKLFFGYPITPQNEIPEYMSKRLFQVGGAFVQAESEVAASNMIYGSAAVGERVMTSSSSPGMALKQEAISYCAGAELPVVIVNIMRGGPGLGGIQPSQSDYWQATKPGHGDFHSLVLAPASIQEAVDLVMDAFDLADQYRNPVLILADGLIGQMMEPVTFRQPTERVFDKSWAVTGCVDRKPNIVNSLFLQPQDLEDHNHKLFRKYAQMEREEVRVEEYLMDDAELAIAAYGTTARIARTAVDAARTEGIKVGLIRPITLFPFPKAAFERYVGQVKVLLDVEMSMGQMIEDVRLAVHDRIPVRFYGRVGGMVPSPGEILDQIRTLAQEVSQ